MLPTNTHTVRINIRFGRHGSAILEAQKMLCRWILREDTEKKEVYIRLYTEKECLAGNSNELPPGRTLLRQEWVYEINNGSCSIVFQENDEEKISFNSFKIPLEAQRTVEYLVSLAIKGESYEIERVLFELCKTKGLTTLKQAVSIP